MVLKMREKKSCMLCVAYRYVYCPLRLPLEPVVAVVIVYAINATAAGHLIPHAAISTCQPFLRQQRPTRSRPCTTLPSACLGIAQHSAVYV